MLPPREGLTNCIEEMKLVPDSAVQAIKYGNSPHSGIIRNMFKSKVQSDRRAIVLEPRNRQANRDPEASRAGSHIPCIYGEPEYPHTLFVLPELSILGRQKQQLICLIRHHPGWNR